MQDGPSMRDSHFGYDGFAVIKNQHNHVAEKYVVYQCVNSFYERMEYENNMCIILTSP